VTLVTLLESRQFLRSMPSENGVLAPWLPSRIKITIPASGHKGYALILNLVVVTQITNFQKYRPNLQQ
jgi:hypothetical protein